MQCQLIWGHKTCLIVEPSNLTLQQLELNCCVVWPEEKWPPDWAWFLPRFFSPFCHQWSFGSLPLSPLACLVGDTSFPAISSTWLNRNFLNWTELDDAITEFNNEIPLTENWVLIWSFYIIDTIFPFWYCAVALSQFVLLKALYK